MRAAPVKFKIHPLAIVTVAFFIWNKAYARLLVSALLHELGHALAAWLVGRRGLVFTLTPLGFSLYAGEMSGVSALAVYLAGPAVSLALAPWLSPQTLWVLVFNLIPVLPLDGGRAAAVIMGEKAALSLGSLAMLFMLLLSALHDLPPVGLVAALILHWRYTASGGYMKIRRTADFLRDLY